MIFSNIEELLRGTNTHGILVPRVTRFERQEIATWEAELGVELHPSIRHLLAKFDFFDVEFGTAWILPKNEVTLLKDDVESGVVLIEVGDVVGYYKLVIDNETGRVFAQNADLPEYFELIADSIEKAILRLATIATERLEQPAEVSIHEQHAQYRKRLDFLVGHGFPTAKYYQYADGHLVPASETPTLVLNPGQKKRVPSFWQLFYAGAI